MNKPPKNQLIIRLNAGNDRNGNPRRCYVCLAKEADGFGTMIVDAWNEGYAGYGAVPPIYRDMAHKAPTFETTPSEYRSILKNNAKVSQ